MPTISARRGAAAAALLLLGWAGPAAAGATIEIDPKYETFESRTGCEKVLKQRHSAALSRLRTLPATERNASKVSDLRREGEHLSYAERLDLSGEAADPEMPRSQTELFTCLGARLEHRIDLGE
jgi:hypothetical protein